MLKVVLYAAVLVAVSEGLPAQSRYLRSRFLGRYGPPARRLRKILVGVTATAALLSALMFATRLGAFDLETLTYLAGTAPFHGWGLILTGALLNTAAARGVWARRLSAGLMLMGLSWSGHLAAASAGGRLIALAHLAAASWWIGSMLSLAHVLPRFAGGRLGMILADFSTRASFAVALLLAAGGLATLLLARSQALSFSYLLALGVKLGLVFIVLLLALNNKLRISPLAPHEGPTRLGRSVRLELVLVGLVLAATAALTTFVAPHEGH